MASGPKKPKNTHNQTSGTTRDSAAFGESSGGRRSGIDAIVEVKSPAPPPPNPNDPDKDKRK